MLEAGGLRCAGAFRPDMVVYEADRSNTINSLPIWHVNKFTLPIPLTCLFSLNTNFIWNRLKKSRSL
jgi:hypothetical protein